MLTSLMLLLELVNSFLKLLSTSKRSLKMDLLMKPMDLFTSMSIDSTKLLLTATQNLNLKVLMMLRSSKKVKVLLVRRMIRKRDLLEISLYGNQASLASLLGIVLGVKVVLAGILNAQPWLLKSLVTLLIFTWVVKI